MLYLYNKVDRWVESFQERVSQRYPDSSVGNKTKQTKGPGMIYYSYLYDSLTFMDVFTMDLIPEISILRRFLRGGVPVFGFLYTIEVFLPFNGKSGQNYLRFQKN